MRSVDLDDGVSALTLELSDVEREEVAAALVRGGFGVRRLEPVRSDLERVFLDLVRGEGGARTGGESGT